MKLKATLVSGILLLLCSMSLSAQHNTAGLNFINSLKNDPHKVFIQNDGQLDNTEGLEGKKIMFSYYDERGMNVYFTSTGVIYKISKEEKVSDREYENAMKEHGLSVENDLDHADEPKTLLKTAFIEMNWAGANANPDIKANDPTNFYFNYYVPTVDDKKRVIGNVKGFNELVYENIYPGIDLKYTIHPEDGIKYSYVLHPGADPSVIKMIYNGGSLKKDASGNLIISTDCGDITDHAPLTYKETQVEGNIVESSFVVNKNEVSFNLANGQTAITQTTVIDPWQVGPTWIGANWIPDDLSIDGVGNILVYSYKAGLFSATQRIDKYSPAGAFIWTFNLTTSTGYSNFAQGDVDADPAGNVYVCIGLGPNNNTAFYNTIKINPAGTALLWGNATAGTGTNNMMETWTITFNCTNTQFYQSGGGRIIAGTTYFNLSVEEPVNAATGAEGTLIENDSLGDIYCTYYAPNSLVYHMTTDSNITPNLAGGLMPASTGAHNNLICFNPATGIRLFRVQTGYAYIDGDYKAPGSIGMNAMASSCQYLYTTNGAKLDRWNPTTGAHYNQVTIPGGSAVPGNVNSGITTDKCGNVYVGSNNNVYVYDANLNLINTIGGFPGRVFDLAWGDVANTMLDVCGGTSNATTFLSQVSVTTCVLPNMVTITPVQPTCTVPTGSATANATFCGSPYSYSWSNGQITQTATGLTPGTYTVTVSSSISCPYSYVQTQTVTITPASGSLTSAPSQANVTCFGSCNGTASLVASGGTAPYTYVWSPAPGGGQGTPNATGLCATNYSCTITDAGGCSITQAFTITQPLAITATPSQVNVTCNGSCNGSASVVAAGGTGTYTYLWSPAPGGGQGTANATGLCATNYTCTISSPAGCSITQAFTITQPLAITATPSQVNVTCNGSCNGSASVVAAGGTGTYTYVWSPAPGGGQGTANATGLCATNYTCTISSPAGCSITQAFTITQPLAITATPSQVNVTCNGSCNGSASVVAAGGTGTYTYLWSPAPGGGQGTANATGLCATNYTCTISSPAGCSITQAFTITQPLAITATPSQVNVTCNGSCNGSASVVAAGGTGTYTYVWSPAPGGGQGTANATGLCATNYTCTISSPAGCSITQAFTITQPTPVLAPTSTTPATCGGSNGTATVTASGGVGPYTYSWAPTGGTGPTASGLAAGSYTVTVTSVGGCTVTGVAVVASTGGITASITASTNVSCFGGSNGSATAAPTGGVGPYTYSWAPSGGTGATASGLIAGSYTCTVTDFNGCIATASITIIQPLALTATQSQINVLCNGASTGSATVVASGGSPAYTYAWTPSGGTAATASGLAANTYTCTITDSHGCSITQSFTITQPTPVTGTTTSIAVNCNGGNNGTGTVNPSGGTPGYTYSWAPAGGTGTTTTGVIAGNYTVTITDANGCNGTATVAINQPTAVTAGTTTTPATCGNPNGSATAIPGGGVGPYSYSWAPAGGTGITASGLLAGSYTVTVTDAHGCSATAVAVVTNSGGPTATISSTTDILCSGGNNGSITVTGTGGTPAYTYAWAPSGGTAATAPALIAGSYTVTLTDANGCSTTASAVITQPPVLSATAVSTPVLCNGGSTGTATVTPAGGSPAYTYAWTPSGGTGSVASGLTATSYTCTLTDANGCTTTASTTVTQPTALTSPISTTPVLCNGGTTGTASVVPAGGTPGYTFAWTPSGGSAATAPGLAAGNYTCTVTDANGCIITPSVAVTEPTVISLATSFVQSTCGSANGSASVVASGGSAGYTYSWAPSGGTAATANGLLAGSYTVTVTDANLCTATATVAVPNAGSPTATISSTTDILCSGGNNGSITVTGTGGTPAYTYAWAPSGGTAATAPALIAGSYTVILTDANGCSTTASAVITQPPALTISGTSTNVDCFGNATGSASVTAAGGVTAYSYAWAPSGGTAATAPALTAGSYTCTATDANGCTITQSLTITEPPQLTLAIAGFNVSCFNSCNGQVVVIPSGGVPNYTFAWNTGCNSPSCNNICAGSYTVNVTDANGCLTTASTTVTQPAAITVVTAEVDAHCNQADGSASAVGAGGTGPLTYQWIGGPASANYNNITPNTYSVIVTDANGCADTTSTTVNNLNGVNATLSSVTDLTCFNSNNGAIVTAANGGIVPYTYSWTAPALSAGATATSLPAGSYTLTVTDASGCTSTVSATVTQPAPVTLAAAAAPPAVCSGATIQLSANATGGTPGYTYTWAPGPLAGSSQNITPLASATYTVYVLDANGCADSSMVPITVNPVPTAALSGDVLSGCAPLCVNFTDVSTIAAPAVLNSWAWDFGDGSPISNLQNPSHCFANPGPYSVSLSINTPSGCAASLTMPAYINVFANPVAAFGASPQPTTILNPLVTFTDSSTNAASWNWNFGDIANSGSTLQNPSFAFPDPTCYQVTLAVTSPEGCVDTATQQICIGPDVTLFVPNAFTPNDDGKNDIFMPVGVGIDPDHFEMWIFDRWGNMIYYTDDMAKGWDGRVQGHSEICQIDTYVWKIKAIDIMGNKHNLIGKVSIIK